MSPQQEQGSGWNVMVQCQKAGCAASEPPNSEPSVIPNSLPAAGGVALAGWTRLGARTRLVRRGLHRGGFGGFLQAVAECALIAAPGAELPALALPGFHQMFQAAGTRHERSPALSAATVALLAKLVLSLPGDWQVLKFVFYCRSHFSLCA